MLKVGPDVSQLLECLRLPERSSVAHPGRLHIAHWAGYPGIGPDTDSRLSSVNARSLECCRIRAAFILSRSIVLPAPQSALTFHPQATYAQAPSCQEGMPKPSPGMPAAGTWQRVLFDARLLDLRSYPFPTRTADSEARNR